MLHPLQLYASSNSFLSGATNLPTNQPRHHLTAVGGKQHYTFRDSLRWRHECRRHRYRREPFTRRLQSQRRSVVRHRPKPFGIYPKAGNFNYSNQSSFFRGRAGTHGMEDKTKPLLKTKTFYNCTSALYYFLSRSRAALASAAAFAFACAASRAALRVSVGRLVAPVPDVEAAPPPPLLPAPLPDVPDTYEERTLPELAALAAAAAWAALAAAASARAEADIAADDDPPPPA